MSILCSVNMMPRGEHWAIITQATEHDPQHVCEENLHNLYRVFPTKAEFMQELGNRIRNPTQYGPYRAIHVSETYSGDITITIEK